MDEFKVNDYLKMKLENGETNIYMKDRLFTQCKYILLDIPVKEVSLLEELESIDEAAEKLDKLLENVKSN